MTRSLYELVGRDDNRFSPYCWRSLMALTHKGLSFERIPCRFTDKARIAFSGQNKVPVLTDDDQVIHDSWAIARYLETAYPDRPTLFPGGESSQALTHFVNAWTDTRLNPAILRLIILDLFQRVDPPDQEYFRHTREQRLGAKLETLHATRDEHRDAFRDAVQPLATLLDERAYLSGPSPAYADYIVFGTLQWARLASPLALIDDMPGMLRWRERMLDLFDGLGRSAGAASRN